MSNFADTNRANLRIIPETQWGQTPTSGTSRLARITSHSFAAKKATTMSNEIRDDRMVSNIIETESSSDGGFNFEFSAGVIDDLLQGFVYGSWTRPMTHDFWEGKVVSFIANNKIAIQGGDVTAYFTAGRRLKTDNFVSPLNNDFWQISSVTFNSGANQTEITLSTTTAVVEAGNVKGRVSDANDVIVLRNTAIRSGTAGANVFDSNGGNAFASAIAAGQLLAGQKIHVERLGYDTGTVSFTAVAVAGSSVTVSDGVNSYVFVAGTDFAIGTTATTSATNLALAINTSRVLGIGAAPGVAATFVNAAATSAVGVVTIRNMNITGGTLSKTESGTNITVVAFSGGDDTQQGIFTIASVTSDQIFTVESVGTNANSGSLAVTVRGSMLRNPLASNITPQSFTIEAGFGDVAKFLKQDGMRVSTFALDVNSGAVLSGSAEFMGRATTAQTVTVLGTSPFTALAAPNTEVMNSTTDVGAISKNGTSLATAVKQIKLDGKAGLRSQTAVGSKYPVGIGAGRLEISGSIQAYFQTFDMFNNFLNHETVSLGWPLQDSRGVHYEFTVPAVKFTADPVNIRGIDQDVMEDITWQAQRDPVTNCVIQIDRFSSLTPV